MLELSSLSFHPLISSHLTYIRQKVKGRGRDPIGSHSGCFQSRQDGLLGIESSSPDGALVPWGSLTSGEGQASSNLRRFWTTDPVIWTLGPSTKHRPSHRTTAPLVFGTF